MKTYVHVNKFVIAKNVKSGQVNKPLRVKNYKENIPANVIAVVDDNGKEIGRFVYTDACDGYNQLSCGARVYFQSDSKNIKVIE